MPKAIIRLIRTEVRDYTWITLRDRKHSSKTRRDTIKSAFKIIRRCGLARMQVYVRQCILAG